MPEVSGSRQMRAAPGPADRVADWLRLLTAIRALYESLEGVIAPFGLMLRDYELLRCLRGRALSQSVMVFELHTSKVSVSRGVRRLGAQGWLNVKDSPGDKRKTSVALTDRGAERLAQVDIHVTQFLTALAATLDEDERLSLTEINAALRQALHRLDGSSAARKG